MMEYILEFHFENKNTRAYYYSDLHDANNDTYFDEVFIMIPTDDNEILMVIKYVMDKKYGFELNESLLNQLNSCINGQESFEIDNYMVICGDRGQGIYFRLYDLS